MTMLNLKLYNKTNHLEYIKYFVMQKEAKQNTRMQNSRLIFTANKHN